MALEQSTRALVIGGCGFVGKHLVQQLLAAGHPVRVFDLQPYPDPQVESVVGDLRKAEQVLQACHDVGTVFCVQQRSIGVGAMPSSCTMSMCWGRNMWLLLAKPQVLPN